MLMRDLIEHYNKLIDENNDPARDPKPLRDYMDKWDGEKFIESMQLDKSKSALEIGIGTGRLAIKVAPNCKSLCGIDISEKTIQRATENLSTYQNIKLICGNFMASRPVPIPISKADLLLSSCILSINLSPSHLSI